MSASHRTWHGWYGTNREISASAARIVDHLASNLEEYGYNKAEMRSLLCTVLSDEDLVHEITEAVRRTIESYPEGTREG